MRNQLTRNNTVQYVAESRRRIGLKAKHSSSLLPSLADQFLAHLVQLIFEDPALSCHACSLSRRNCCLPEFVSCATRLINLVRLTEENCEAISSHQAHPEKSSRQALTPELLQRRSQQPNRILVQAGSPRLQVPGPIRHLGNEPQLRHCSYACAGLASNWS